MESEALRNLRTMRDIRTFNDIARSQRFKTIGSVSKTKEEMQHLSSLTDRKLDQVLQAEQRRFALHEAAVERSRKRMRRSREKLAVTINRNRALMRLRYELQMARSGNDNPSLPPRTESSPWQHLRQIDLRY